MSASTGAGDSSAAGTVCPCLLCAPPGEPLTTQDAKVRDDVVTYGWHVVLVGGGDQLPPWAFTVGLWHSCRQPELAIFGLPLDVAHEILNDMATSVLDGAVLPDGLTSDAYLEGLDVLVKDVDRSWHPALFGTLRWFYQGAEGTVSQVVWPDGAGAFPGHPSHDPMLAEMQPTAWVGADAHPPSPWAAWARDC